MINKICQKCGKEFRVYKCNFERTKFCSKKCMVEFLRGETFTKICPKCGKEFSFNLNQRRRDSIFCSLECYNKWKKGNMKFTDERNKNLSEKMTYLHSIKKYPTMGFQKGHTSWLIGLTKETDERLKRKAEKMTGRKRPTELVESTASKLRGRKRPEHSKWLKEHYDIIHTPEAHRKQSENSKGKNTWSKEYWQDKDYKQRTIKAQRKGMHVYPNKPETILINLIKENNLPFMFTGDGKIIIEGFNPDFTDNNGTKKIIELNGDYWHNRKDVAERDARKIEAYKRIGFDTLFIWEHELKDKQTVLNKINDFIKSPHGQLGVIH